MFTIISEIFTEKSLKASYSIAVSVFPFFDTEYWLQKKKTKSKNEKLVYTQNSSPIAFHDLGLQHLASHIEQIFELAGWKNKLTKILIPDA